MTASSLIANSIQAKGLLNYQAIGWSNLLCNMYWL